MTCEKGILHTSFSNRSSSPTQKSSLGRKKNSWVCWGFLDAGQSAVLMQMWCIRDLMCCSSEVQSGGGEHPTALLTQYPCSCGQGPPGTLPTATWEPCPGSKSTSISHLRMVVPCAGGSSQLRNFSLQSSCQWEMESHDEETSNRIKRGEKTGPRDGAVPHQQGWGEKGSWGAVGEGLQEPPTFSRSTNTRSVYPGELQAGHLPGGDP